MAGKVKRQKWMEVGWQGRNRQVEALPSKSLTERPAMTHVLLL